MRPHIYRTHDGGKTWTHITNGIPDGAPVNVVREDAKRKGLLFAGTEREVYVSFDDGEHWQSLRLNMPATSMRDLIVKDDDVVVATHGRGFWILDDITPLRQFDAAVADAPVTLFKPQVAYRVRWNMNTDTPLPPDEPRGENPPDGAIIDYTLKAAANGPGDARDPRCRRARSCGATASTDPVEKPDAGNGSGAAVLVSPAAGAAGHGRHASRDVGLPLSAAAGRRRAAAACLSRPCRSTPSRRRMRPGRRRALYTVKLTVDGKSYSQPLTVKMDPRVKAPAPALATADRLAKALYDGARDAQSSLQDVRALRATVRQAKDQAGQAPVAAALDALDKKLAALEGLSAAPGGRGAGGGGGAPGGRGGAAGGPDTFSSIGGTMTPLMSLLQAADAAATEQLLQAVAERRDALAALTAKWTALKTVDLAALNAELTKAGMAALDGQDSGARDCGMSVVGGPVAGRQQEDLYR